MGKNLLRVLSAVVASATVTQYCTAAVPQTAFAVETGTNYAIYSSDDITVNTHKAVINGNVFSGDSLSYLGAETCYINRALNAGSTSGQIVALVDKDIRSIMPDFTDRLNTRVSYRNVYQDKALINADKYDITGSVSAGGSLHIDRTSFSGKGYIKANGDIRYDAVQNSDGAELFITSESGDIVLSGADLTFNGILYAPKGKVVLNCKHLHINGSIIAQNVEINGTDLVIDPLTESGYDLMDFDPELVIAGIETVHKQNRKIVLDVSASYGLPELDADSLQWSFVSKTTGSSECVRIDNDSSGPLHKELIITAPGEYEVVIMGTDKKGSAVEYTNLLTVVEDIAPVAAFTKSSDLYSRDKNGKSQIILKDASYSPDGDDIASRVWAVTFDSNNNGDFSDDTEEVFCTGNEKEVTYTAESVGKYRFRLTAAEMFTDTIPALLPEMPYRYGSTTDLENIDDTIEVTNDAPQSASGIKKAKNVDMIVTVGNADIDDINTLNKNIDDITKELEDDGYSVNIATVSTSTLTARDTFAWDEYDHYNYADQYLPTLDKHILYEGDSIKMVGYSVAPLRDWLFVDDGIKARRVLSFDMVRDRTDWHSMEGGGFLFNTSIKEETTGEGEEKTTVRKMNGYCILLTSGGFRLIQFSDIDADKFRDGGISYSAMSAGKVLKDVSVSDVYADYSVKIVADSRLVSVYLDDEPVIDNFVLPDDQTGSGFGPIICHASHSCSQQSYFTFSNIRMTTVMGSELGDALDKFNWRDSAKHFAVNLSKEKVYDLRDNASAGSAVSSLITNKAELIGLGSAASKEQYDLLLRSADGQYADWYDVLKDKDVLRNMIYSSLANENYDIKDNMITTSDEIEYTNSFADRENDPVGDQVWKYDLDASVYENSTGKTGSFTSEKPLTQFGSTGKYSISFDLSDDPTHSNSALDPYKKWAEHVDMTEELYVHTKPSAELGYKLSEAEDTGKFICTLTYSSSDTDCESHKAKGITEERFQWKRVDDSAWQEGTVPGIISAGDILLQKYEVKDKQGQWSDPAVALIIAEKSEDTSVFTDDKDPEAVLTVSDESPCAGDQILISSSADDDTGIAYVKTTVNGSVVSAFPGSVIYECRSAGELAIVVECSDIAGNTSKATKTITVGPPRDASAPVISVDPETGITVSGKDVTISGSVTDGDQLSGYTVSYAEKDGEDYTQLIGSSDEVSQGVIAQFTLPEEGAEYDVLLTATDGAGNSSYFKFTVVTGESDEGGESSGIEQSTEPETEAPTERADTPAEITITAAPSKAEVGEIVNVKALASDPDGLVSVKVFKNDELIADAPCEFRFSEAEAGVVTIRVETTDMNGGTSQKSEEVIFEDNSDRTPPEAVIASPSDGETVSGKVSVTGTACDETGLRSYKLEYRPAGGNSFTPVCSSFNERIDAELGIWDTTNLPDGSYEVKLSVTDNGGNLTYVTAGYTVSNTVRLDEQQLTNDLIVIERPSDGTKADDKLHIDAQADESLAGSEYSVSVGRKDGTTTVVSKGTIDSTGAVSADVDTSLYDEGNYTVTINVKDSEGNIISRTANAVVDHGMAEADEKYQCRIVSPDGTEDVTGKTEVTAEITQYGFKKFKFEYSPMGEDSYTVFSSGTIGSEKELSAEFDPTLLFNGIYDIRLTVWGDNGMAQDTVSVSVAGGLKAGNFSITFNDLEIDAGGIPVSVKRTYDSRGKDRSGTFGFGWDLSYSSVKIRMSGSQSDDWQQEASGSFITQYKLREGHPHRIVVDLGNGVTDEFAMQISPASQPFFPIQLDISASYVSVTGSGATLVPVDMHPGDLIYDSHKLLTFEFNDYDPQVFRYTTKDGTEYVISAKDGLRSVKTSTGENISFSSDGITSDSGDSFSFTHDSAGRITKVTDNNGRSVSYEYNAAGDLIRVTDVGGEVTSFAYNDHYLIEITDPRGVKAVRNEYDDEGRLSKSIDAEGNAITYEHNIDGREEVITNRNGGVTRYIYDDAGNILSVTDPMGNTETRTYDENGNVTSVTDALGNKQEFTYDSNGNVLTAKNAAGVITANTYNSKGKVTSVEFMGMTAISNEYDDNGNLTSMTDIMGNTSSMTYSGNKLTSLSDSIGKVVNITYDASGNPVSIADASGSVTRMTYDEKGRCITKTSSTSSGEELTETYSYDDYDQITKVIGSDGSITTREYNSFGKVIRETAANGGQKSYEYDSRGNLTKVIYPDGTSESFAYDKEGYNTSATDRSGRTMTMEYDAAGNLLRKNYPGGATEEFTYDNGYRLISKTGINGGVTTYTYDSLNRNTSVTDALGNTFTYTYNDASEISSMTDAEGNVFRYTYDAGGNRTSTIFPDDTSITSKYDVRGRLVSSTDQNGRTTSYTYDASDRLTSVTDAAGGVTSYSYGAAGELTSVTDANGRVTKYGYDSLRRPTSITNALGQTMTFTYDSQNNVVAATDFGGKQNSYTYDIEGRVTSKKNADGNTSFSYSRDGKLLSVSDRDSVTRYTYDDNGQVISVSNSVTGTVNYTYDNAGRVTMIGAPGGNTLYAYDALDRLTSVTDRSGNVTRYTYNRNGFLIKTEYPNGVTAAYTCDALSRLVNETVTNSAGEVIAQYGYTLGAAGEKLSVTELSRSISYTYDALYRLTSESVTENGETTVTEYTYDGVSNLITKTVNGETTHYTYNAADQLISENNITYTYDNSGNRISMDGGNRSANYVYDADNRLTGVTMTENGITVSEEYRYDYNGTRISRTTDGDTVYYVNDSVIGDYTQVLEELDAGGFEKCFYTRGEQIISQDRGQVISYYLTDGHGSVRQLSGSEGTVTDSYNYDPWGKLTSREGETVNTYLYCAEQHDETTGYYYLRARYMDPSTGTFTSMDSYQGNPFDPVSLNKYLYASANPIMNIDPSGHFSLGEAVAVGAIMGALTSLAITVGMNILRSWDHPEEAVNPFEGWLMALLKGAFFGALFAFLVAKCIIIALIIAAVGLMTSLCKAFDSFQNDEPWEGAGYVILAILSIFGMKKLVKVSSGQTPVSRWGRPGVKDGDWVMTGKQSLSNFIRSFKRFPGGGNKPIYFKNNPNGPYTAYGSDGTASYGDLSWPHGPNGEVFFSMDGCWKFIFGQRIYEPSTVHYDYIAEFSLFAYLMELFFGSGDDE